jgi:hypothetical protein
MPDEKDTSRFDDWQKAPTPSPLKASNTLESLRPRDISWPTATLPGPGYAGAPADVPLELDPYRTYDPVRKTDKFTEPEQAPKLNANVLPVDWPSSSNAPSGGDIELAYTERGTAYARQKPIPSVRSLEDRIEKLEGLVDGLLDRIATHNTKSSHKI